MSSTGSQEVSRSASFISLANQALLDSKDMELVGCEIETEHSAVNNPLTIGPQAVTVTVWIPLRSTWLARDMQKTRMCSKLCVTRCLKAHGSDFFYAGIKTSVPRCNNCLDANGDHVKISCIRYQLLKSPCIIAVRGI